MRIAATMLVPEFENDERVAEWIELVEEAVELTRESDEEPIEITDEERR